MRNGPRFLVVVLAALVLVGAPVVLAATPPEVTTIIEGQRTVSGEPHPVLMLIGSRLTKLKKGLKGYPQNQQVEQDDRITLTGPIPSSQVFRPLAPPTITVTTLLIEFGNDVPTGTYTLVVEGLPDMQVGVGNGRPLPSSVGNAALDPVLQSTIADASSLTQGTLSTDRFSAWDDLATDGRLGPGSATQLARTDDVYRKSESVSKSELGDDDETKPNEGTGHVSWSKLKDVPAGFADGFDDGGYEPGEGIGVLMNVISVLWDGQSGDHGTATTAARSDHAHDGRYNTKAQLYGSGTINMPSNPVDWTQLKNVPAGIADGVDSDTSYTAGPGIDLTGGVISVKFGVASGTAAQGNDTRLPPSPASAGRILYDSGFAWNALGTGSNGQVLKLAGGLPAWGTDSNTSYTAGTGLDLTESTFSVKYGTTSGTAAQGDDARLAPTPSTQGRILYDSGTAWATRSAGSDGQVLKMSGGLPVWGTDNDTTYSAGNGLSLSSSTFSVSSVGWGQLTGIPGGFADGVDDTGLSSISAGTGISVSGNQVSVNFGSGANQAATGSHSHDGTYLKLAGGTMSGALTVQPSSSGVAITSIGTSGADAIQGYASGAANGVYGSTGSSSLSGVYGNNSSSGNGVKGQSSSGTGVYGTSTSGAGISGNSSSGYGVQGQSTSNYGLRAVGTPYGTSSITTGSATYRAGGYFDANPTGSNYYALVGYYSNGTDYKILGSGVNSTIMDTRDGRKVLFSPESPEVYFEDYGRGQLIAGHCRVDLDPRFLDCLAVSEATPLAVFVQLNDDCKGVFVRTDGTGFDVRESQGGFSTARFTYRVVGKRKGYEHLRFPVAPEKTPEPPPSVGR